MTFSLFIDCFNNSALELDCREFLLACPADPDAAPTVSIVLVSEVMVSAADAFALLDGLAEVPSLEGGGLGDVTLLPLSDAAAAEP